MVERCFGIGADGISRKEVGFAMGYGDSEPDSGIKALVEDVISELVPVTRLRYIYDIVPAEKISPRQIRMAGKLFTPDGIICSYLDGMTRACVFIATAGREFASKLSELHQRGDIVLDFIADSLGSVLAETAVSRIEDDLPSQHPLSLSYSPGYCNWDIREQKILFSLFPPEPCGVTLTDSSLMIPEKSVSGFFAMGEKLVRQPYHCQICKNTKCYKRREQLRSL